MKRIGQLIFLGAIVLALALYWLTMPEGLPWNGSTHLALAYLDEIVRLPKMPHPIWGCYVQVFGGAVVLSIVMAALAAGLIAVTINRYFGWRFATSVALVWIFFPGVWNRAITGERGVCLAAMVVVAVWVVNGVALRVLRKAREVRAKAKNACGAQGLTDASVTVHDEAVKRGKKNRIAGWVAMGVAGVFALASLTLHDYRLGEAASVFARGVVEAAGDRVVVLNGVCDDQVARESKARREEAKSKGEGEERNSGGQRLTALPTGESTLSLRNDDAYRAWLVAAVKAAFPAETNLWVAAQVSAETFAEAAVKSHPERFYLMSGKDTTLEAWEKRWKEFKPYLASSDPFVPAARRLFGYEGNAVANAMLEEGAKGEESKSKGEGEERNITSAAWQLYKRIYDEICPGNISALVNMSEMIRRGYAANGKEKKWVQEGLERFFKDAANRQHARGIVRAAGPIRSDPVVLEKLAAEVKKRIAEKIAAGEKVEYSPEILSLVEWNNEMVKLMNEGELVQAGRIARAILSNPKWQGFVPANAVMGSVAAQEGDFVASEAFFKAATETTNEVPAVVLNDYADTLIHLGKLDEAERQARRAVKESEESIWIARLTLAEVLEKKAQAEKEKSEVDERALAAFAVEIRELLKSVMSHAPAKVGDKVRKEHRGYLR